MQRTESEPRDTKLQSARDADHTIRGVGNDGVFCCPECGTVLRLEQGSEVEGDGRTTLPGMPSSSSVIERRDAEPPYVAHPQTPQDASAAVAPQPPAIATASSAGASSSTVSYLGPAAFSSTAAYLGTSVFSNTAPPHSDTVAYAAIPQLSADAGLPSLIDDPADLAPADTDEPTRVTRTNNLSPQMPALPPPPPLIAEEIARRASMGLPLPVLPPPPVAPVPATDSEGDVEELDALLASQPAPHLSPDLAPLDAPATMTASDAAEKRAKHPLPVPHPVFVSVPLRRSDASTTPLAGIADPQIERQTAPIPPVQTDPTVEALTQASLNAVEYPAPSPDPIVEPGPTQLSSELVIPAAASYAAEAVAQPVAAAPAAASEALLGNRHGQPLFSDAPMIRDAVATAPPSRRRSSRALWLGLLVVGGGALVLQQGLKSADTTTSSAVSPVVSVVLAAQPAVAQTEAKVEPPPASEQSPTAEESTALKSPQTGAKASSFAARANSVRDPIQASSPKLAPGSKQGAAEDADEDAEKATPSEEPTFDADAAAEALQSAAASASSCRQASDPSGVAVVTITFAPSGRVTTANISGPPFVGTATGSCIAATLRRAKVPAFKGKLVTVRKTVTIQ